MTERAWSRVVALSGGVGGARLLHGLARALPEGALTAVVNTGDDLEHWGLSVSPDLDTVMYTLADLADEARGWGLVDESWGALSMMRRYGADDWFQLGDRDLATHLTRTLGLRRGETLSAVTARMCAALGVGCRVLPMSDAPCRTIIETREHGDLPFQVWFVKHRAAPAVRGVRFEGDAPPAPGLLDAIAAAELIVIGPSNPYVSVDPILSRPGVRDAVFGKTVVALSPIVNGLAVKGPLASMIRELAGDAPGPAAIARHYRGELAGMVVERGDECAGVPTLATDTVMRSRSDSLRLAREILAFAGGLAHETGVRALARDGASP